MIINIPIEPTRARMNSRWRPMLTENDPIQKALCGLMEHRVAQQEQVDDKDARAELAARNALLLDAEKTRKEAVLAIKRHQVGEELGSLLSVDHRNVR